MEGYRALYDRSVQDPEGFWGDIASRELHWFEKWSKVLEWNPPFAKWFVGGKINASYNCLDRHLTTHRKNKVAILWEGEPGDQRMISYQELQAQVVIAADGSWRRGKEVRLKDAVDEAVSECPSVRDVIVYRRTGGP